MNTSTKYACKLMSSSFHEVFLKFLLCKSLQELHDLVEKVQLYGCVLLASRPQLCFIDSSQIKLAIPNSYVILKVAAPQVEAHANVCCLLANSSYDRFRELLLKPPHLLLMPPRS